MNAPVLSVRELVVEFSGRQGISRAVDGVSFDLLPGRTLGLIGESGSGKSLTALAAIGLAPRTAKVSGQVLFSGSDLLALSDRDLRRIRGRDIGMIFQDPMTSLNPTQTVGRQIEEALRVHNRRMRSKVIRRRAIELLTIVGVPRPAGRLSAYPHAFSGGMRQRVVIAMAIANNPRVLFADEPTTALDVTIQAQILDVLAVARAETDAAIVLISHDLALVSESADHIAVMYGGKLVEVTSRSQLFSSPRHPYTAGLLGSLPRLDADVDRLFPIPGNPPGRKRPPGCAFHPRCPLQQGRKVCEIEMPALLAVELAHVSRCHFADEMPALVDGIEDLLGVRLGGAST